MTPDQEPEWWERAAVVLAVLLLLVPLAAVVWAGAR